MFGKEMNVLKAIVECQNEKGITLPQDVCEKLKVPDSEILEPIRYLKAKKYIDEDISCLYVTDKTMEIYNKLISGES